MKDIKAIFKGTIVYLVGTVFTKLLQFFLLPLYTKYLTPVEFGNYDLELAYATFLWTFLYLDIFGGILRFMFDFEKDEKGKAIVNGLALFSISSILYLLASFGFHLIIGESYSHPFLLFLVGFFTVLQQVIGYIARGFEKNQVFVVGGILGSIATFFLTYVFIVSINLSFPGIYFATIGGMIVNIVYVFIRTKLWQQIDFAFFKLDIFSSLLKYLLPLSLNSVSYWFLTGFNRIVISKSLTIYDNGLYAVVMKFGAVISLFTQAFQLAWQEVSFSKAGLDRATQEKFFSQAINKFMIFLLIGASASLPVISITYKFIIDQQYADAYCLIPLALISAVFTAYASFVASIIGTLKKTKIIFTTTLFGSLVNIIVLFTLIESIGVSSALLSLSMGFFTIFIRRVQLLKRELRIRINWNKISIFFLLFLCSSVIYIVNISYINIISFFAVVVIGLWTFKNDISFIVGNKK